MKTRRLLLPVIVVALVWAISLAPSVMAGASAPVTAESPQLFSPPLDGGGTSAETDTEGVTAPVEVVPIVPHALDGASTIYAVDLRNDDLDMLATNNPNATIIAANTGNYYGGDFANNDFTKIYAVNDTNDNLDTIAVANGAITTIGSMGAPAGNGTWGGMTWDPTTSTMYAISNVAGTTTAVLSLYTVNLTTGAATLVATGTSQPSLVIDVAAHPTTGELYGVDIFGDNTVTINKTTAAITTVGPTGFAANFAQGMDFDDSTSILYWGAYQGAAVGPGQLRSIDTTTGASTLIGNLSNGVTGETVELDAFSIAAEAVGATATPTPQPTATATPQPTATATPQPTVTATATVVTSIELGDLTGATGGTPYVGWLLSVAGLALVAVGLISRRRR